MSPLILIPLAMHFVPDYWHLFCGILPTYWPIMAYYTVVSESGSDLFFAVTIIMSLLIQLAAAYLFYRKLNSGLVMSVA